MALVLVVWDRHDRPVAEVVTVEEPSGRIELSVTSPGTLSSYEQKMITAQPEPRREVCGFCGGRGWVYP